MLKKDNQNSQSKIKGPLIFEESKWNNIPECIISFFNILNAKIIEIEQNHSSFKTKAEQNFTKQNQVINECKTTSEETEMKFNLSNQTLSSSIKEIKNKCENANNIIKIKMEEEVEKLNKRIDDISRGVNLKIEDNHSLLLLIKKDADLTKDMFQQAIDLQNDESRIINIISASPQLIQFVKDNSGIEEQLNDLKTQVQLEAQQTLMSLLDDQEQQDNSINSMQIEDSHKSESLQRGQLLKKIDKRIFSKVLLQLNELKEEIEKNQVQSNDLVLSIDKEVKELKEQIEQISSITKKCERERKVMDATQLQSKYSIFESQLSNFNDNFDIVQQNMNLISHKLSHKLNNQIKMRSCTPTQFGSNTHKHAGGQLDSNFTSKLNQLPSDNKLSEQNKDKQLDFNIPTLQSENKCDDDKEDEGDIETLEDKIGYLSNRINMLEIQFNQFKSLEKEAALSDTEDNHKKNVPEASKTSLVDKPWLSGQEVILKEGDNLAIKVFQKSQQINKKQSKYQQMYTNPQVMAQKYRNSVLGQDFDLIKHINGTEGLRSNSHSKIKEALPNPSNMTAYYKQNYMYGDSPEKSKKNSINGVNSSNDLQFTNDLIKSQLDNYTSKTKAQMDSQTNRARDQLEQIKTDMNWIDGVNNPLQQQANNNGEVRLIPPPHPRSRNSRTFHSSGHSTVVNGQFHDQNNHSFTQNSNPNSIPQTGINLNISQNANNFQPPKSNQQESPINTYKIAKNVMKNSKLKSFRISQGVSFDAINLSKY